MSESKPKSPLYERPKPFYTLAVLFITVVIVLSTLSIYFYLRAEDYSDAKYRSQSAIVSEMSGVLSTTVSYLGSAIDDNNSNGLRASYAQESYYRLGLLTQCADFIMAQYRIYHDVQEETFRLLRGAFARFAGVTFDAYTELITEPRYETNYQMSSILSDKITTCIPLLQDLAHEFELALGHENVSRYDDHPSSVVDAMDLELVQEIASAI